MTSLAFVAFNCTQLICSFLASPRDILQLATTCKTLYIHCSNDDAVWRPVAKRLLSKYTFSTIVGKLEAELAVFLSTQDLALDNMFLDSRQDRALQLEFLRNQYLDEAGVFYGAVRFEAEQRYRIALKTFISAILSATTTQQIEQVAVAKWPVFRSFIEPMVDANFDGACIGDRGGELIAALLKQADRFNVSKLRSFDGSNQMLRSVSSSVLLKTFCETRVSCRNLRKLSLAHNRLDDSIADALEKFLSVHPNIVSLDLEGNGMLSEVTLIAINKGLTERHMDHWQPFVSSGNGYDSMQRNPNPLPDYVRLPPLQVLNLNQTRVGQSLVHPSQPGAPAHQLEHQPLTTNGFEALCGILNVFTAAAARAHRGVLRHLTPVDPNDIDAKFDRLHNPVPDPTVPLASGMKTLFLLSLQNVGLDSKDIGKRANKRKVINSSLPKPVTFEPTTDSYVLDAILGIQAPQLRTLDALHSDAPRFDQHKASTALAIRWWCLHIDLSNTPAHLQQKSDHYNAMHHKPLLDLVPEVGKEVPLGDVPTSTALFRLQTRMCLPPPMPGDDVARPVVLPTPDAVGEKDKPTTGAGKRKHLPGGVLEIRATGAPWIVFLDMEYTPKSPQSCSVM